ncbi:MAG: AMP-binding protein [Novosphingobium sp.]|nr:AMP-binding protein [Novosphingobium sp.]
MAFSQFADMIREQCRAHPDTTILTFIDIAPSGEFNEETRTYCELLDRGTRLATWLAAHGVGSGDRFAIMMSNHPEFVEGMVAAALLGAVFVPVDPRSMGDKLHFLLDFSECRGVIAADYVLGALAEVAPSCPSLKWTLVMGDGGVPDDGRLPSPSPYRDALLESPREFAPVPGDSPFFMMFTSGTTGNPKGVIQTQATYLAASQGKATGLRESDKLYTGLSLTHINAQGTVRMGLANNVPVVVSRKFTKSRLWDICRAYGCTMFNLLGGMIPEIFAVPPKPDDADNPVRQITTAGMPLALWEAYRKRFGVEIVEVYGSTEGGGFLVNPAGVGPPGSMGRAVRPMLAAVFDEQGRQCPPGVAGELRFRPSDGEAKPVKYFRNEEAGKSKIADGWFCTGDIVHQDEDGWFYFHHRAGGGVRRNGDFVNTALVESVLARAPMVADVFVYGVATPRNIAGEKTLVAAVVPVDPASFDREAFLDFSRRNLEKNDVPEYVQVLEAIPKTASEKPIERECIALLQRSGLIEGGEAGAMPRETFAAREVD